MINSNTQTDILKRYYDMLYPEQLKENEYIRMIALRRDKNGDVGKEEEDKIVIYVNSFKSFQWFINKYRETHDVYNQIATNRGKKDGTAQSQRMRKVIYLDFDKKDYPDMKDAKDCTQMIKNKLPKLFLHACVSSGHGYHYYVSIDPTCKMKETAEINKTLAAILGADKKAALTTQISRPPCTYNHKLDDGTYDYEDKQNWLFVKVIDNRYKAGNQFKTFKLSYLSKLINYYNQEQENMKILETQLYNYEISNEYPCYFCINRVLNEGADKGQRNFWLGRIAKMLQSNGGYSESQIYSICHEYNAKCRPPKSKNIIENEIKFYLEKDYKLLGCYESFKADDPHRKFVENQCDKALCATYHNGAKISITEEQAARINKKILTRKSFSETRGHEFLIVTLLEVYKNSFGRRGFRVRNLQDLLYSSIQKKNCIGEKHLRELLEGLKEKNYIEITPDKKKPDDFKECHLKMSRRLREFQKGYIEFYFSIANALIDGKISQLDYIVYIALVNNLQDRRKVTYDELAETIGLDELSANEIGKHIRKLSRERCLIIEKQYTDKGYEWNKYKLIDPQRLEENDTKENNSNERLENFEINIKLLA